MQVLRSGFNATLSLLKHFAAWWTNRFKVSDNRGKAVLGCGSLIAACFVCSICSIATDSLSQAVGISPTSTTVSADSRSQIADLDTEPTTAPTERATSTARPTDTAVPINTPTTAPTNTTAPTAAPTNTPKPTSTPRPTNTAVPPTATSAPATSTPIPVTNTPIPPTLPPAPTNTAVPPTAPPAPTEPPPPPPPTEPPPASSSDVQITFIFYDGEVLRVESDEFAVITNNGASPMHMGGWRLNAGADGQDFWFPGFDLQPGQSCRVYTNQVNPDSCGGGTFGSSRALWNNDGDCGHLFDNSGAEVSNYCY